MQNVKYITILSSFLDYDLSLNELLIYSIIYGFTQNGQKFTGTYDYINQWLKCNSKKTISTAFKHLRDKGLIKKVADYRCQGKHYCEYISLKNKGEKFRDVKFTGVNFRGVKRELNNTNTLLSNNNINNNTRNNNILDSSNKTINNNTRDNNILDINNNTDVSENKELDKVYKDLDKYIPNANFTFFDTINKYSEKMPLELISFALKETAGNNVRSSKYFKAILDNLLAQNIKSIEEAETYSQQRKKDIEKRKAIKDKAREVYIENKQANAKALKVEKAFNDMDKYIDMFSTTKELNDKGSS